MADTQASSEEGRRLRQFQVSPWGLLVHLRDGYACRVQDGIPNTAEPVDMGYDPREQLFYLTVEHESFDPVPEGQPVPIGTVTFEEIRGE